MTLMVEPIFFTAVFIILVLTLSVVTYVIIINAMNDAYRVNRALDKANEKVRLFGADLGGRLYVVITNAGLSSVDLLNVGYVGASGNTQRILGSLALSPGGSYTGEVSYAEKPVVVFAVTRRGNIFSSPVTDLSATGAQRWGRIDLRTLLPAVYYIPVPVPNPVSGTFFTASVSASSHVFGFVVAKRLNSTQSVLVEFGPYGVADVLRRCSTATGCVPEFVESKSASDTSDGRNYVSVSAKFVFAIDREGNAPTFKLLMPLSCRSSSPGLYVRGCFGVAWRLMLSDVYSVRRPRDLQLPAWGTGGPGYYYSDGIYVLVYPTSINYENLLSIISNADMRTDVAGADPPSGSIVEVYLVRCFTIIDRNATSIALSPDHMPRYSPPSGTTNSIWSVLVFPGSTAFGSGTVYIHGVPIDVVIATARRQ